jgi:hypothetical protein
MIFFRAATKNVRDGVTWAAKVAAWNVFQPLSIALDYEIGRKKLLAAVLLTRPASRRVQPRENPRIYVAS